MEYCEEEISYTKELKKEIRDILKPFNVMVRFGKYANCGAHVSSGTIYMSTDKRFVWTLSTVWSSLFHELSHIMCFREGLYKKYHNLTDIDRQAVIYVRRYGLRAERFVDKKAKALMKQYYPKIPFWSAYSEEEGVDWYRKWVKKNFPLKED